MTKSLAKLDTELVVNVLTEKVDDIVKEVHVYFVELYGKTLNVDTKSMLINVWKSLELIRASPCNDYRLGTVGKFTKAMGGPQTQSMRNASGIHYRNLIDKYAIAAKLPEQATTNNIHDQLLKEVDNKHTQQHIRLIIQENTSLRNQLNVAKQNIAKNAPPIQSTKVMDQTPSLSAPTLSKTKIEAINKFINGLEKKGYSINEFGAINDSDGLELAPPGFIDALRDVLAQFNGNSSGK